MLVSSGIAMEIHYCMGEQAGVEFYGTGSDRCGKCGMTEKKGGCCSDEHKFYKLSDSHKTVSNDIKFTTGEIAVVAEYPSYIIAFPVVAVTSVAVYSYTPPEDTGPPLNIRNCVFRI